MSEPQQQPTIESTLTCVYCGHAYPPGTPSHGHELLTEHIRTCEKHPMRVLEQRIQLLEKQRDILRNAIVRFVEVDGPELADMERAVSLFPPSEDKEKALACIAALKAVPKNS